MDFAVVKKQLLGLKALTGNELKAADVDANKAITIFDLAYIKKYILGKITYQDFPAVGNPK